MQDTAEGKFYTLEEYRSNGSYTEDKDGNQLFCMTHPVQQHSSIKVAEDRGYKVMKLDTMIDSAFMSNMEMKWENVQFKRVDADIAENLIDTADVKESVLSKDEEAILKELFAGKSYRGNSKCGSKRTEP